MRNAISGRMSASNAAPANKSVRSRQVAGPWMVSYGVRTRWKNTCPSLSKRAGFQGSCA